MSLSHWIKHLPTLEGQILTILLQVQKFSSEMLKGIEDWSNVAHTREIYVAMLLRAGA